MYRKEKLTKDIRNRLSDYRYIHSLGVADTARYLAEKYGGDPDKAYMAGLGHDVMKEESREKTLEFFRKENISLTELEMNAPKLWHAISGAIYLEKEYGFDEDTVSAVRYHTTGKENMTLLQKIIFVADFISPERDYPGVEDMRKRAEQSLEYAMEEGLRFTIYKLSGSCAPIHPDTLACYNETVINLRKAEKNG